MAKNPMAISMFTEPSSGKSFESINNEANKPKSV